MEMAPNPYSPFTESSTIMPDATPTFRQLMIITFQCPLCLRQHVAESYVTIAATDREQATHDIFATMASPKHGPEYAAEMARLHHREKGHVVPDRIPPAQIVSIKVDPEQSEYQCDDCGQTFPTIGDLRLHTNRDPVTNAKTPGRPKPVCME